MIVGTAGHIDHGKTTLVKALTGVDTDRLPEEKRRGISIALGYAFMDAGEDLRIGFVDVPGHERLVHTMLSGATGIDHALLLVAADDGVMPQTREHLALLSLLGIRRGTIALTKCDRVDAPTLAQRRGEIRALVAGTSLADAPIVEVAATTGGGVRELREHLIAEARALPPREVAGRAFRLAVDRVFSLAGVGTVCTGTAHAGEVAIGDELLLLPPAPGQSPRRGRVRSLHAQNEPAERASAGQRVAIGLAGLEKDEVGRGQWLAAPEIAQWTDRLDVRLRLGPEEARALRSGLPVHVHVGAEAVTGTVAVLGRFGTAQAAGPHPSPLPQAGEGVSHAAAALPQAGEGVSPVAAALPQAGEGVSPVAAAEALQPGEEGLVQLVLHGPIGAWAGDRVVLRDASATRALAGGVVLDPQAPARYRRTPQRLSELIALTADSPARRLAGLLAQAPMGVDLARFAAGQGVAGDARVALLAAAGASTVVLGADGPAWALGAAQTAQWEAVALARLAQYHEDQPEELGPDLARWRRLAAPRMAEPLWQSLVRRMASAGQVTVSGAAAHLPAHGIQLSALDERLAQKVMPRLLSAGFEGVWARDLAKDAHEPEALVRTTLARLSQRGELFQIVKDLYYAPSAVQTLARIARASAIGGDVKASVFRDRSGLGRKRAIQVLEFFDKVGVLRRVGDAHRLRADCRLFIDDHEDGGAACADAVETA
ncbi:selenocysteine-specific translation elongation factor [Mitsuaria sp. 7]|uniref:selenocysteine-specific translation elongation factor n=1 Tax=Mitsuaria sp. 7 TaxID=1658665 RepID=UPI0007DE22D7|nr:selenocysteine-specific translation elongation factor [Mitsuaria sp. 7]ANH66439.1 selenocysteine-specific elongation factor [Mitsuaria sp. 7]